MGKKNKNNRKHCLNGKLKHTGIVKRSMKAMKLKKIKHCLKNKQHGLSSPSCYMQFSALESTSSNKIARIENMRSRGIDKNSSPAVISTNEWKVSETEFLQPTKSDVTLIKVFSKREKPTESKSNNEMCTSEKTVVFDIAENDNINSLESCNENLMKNESRLYNTRPVLKDQRPRINKINKKKSKLDVEKMKHHSNSYGKVLKSSNLSGHKKVPYYVVATGSEDTLNSEKQFAIYEQDIFKLNLEKSDFNITNNFPDLNSNDNNKNTQVVYGPSIYLNSDIDNSNFVGSHRLPKQQNHGEKSTLQIHNSKKCDNLLLGRRVAKCDLEVYESETESSVDNQGIKRCALTISDSENSTDGRDIEKSDKENMSESETDNSTDHQNNGKLTLEISKSKTECSSKDQNIEKSTSETENSSDNQDIENSSDNQDIEYSSDNQDVENSCLNLSDSEVLDNTLARSDVLESNNIIASDSSNTSNLEERYYEKINVSTNGNRVDVENDIQKLSLGDDCYKNCEYYVLNHICIFILHHPCKLALNGKLIASCISGEVDICGYRLTDKKKLVFSPRGHCLLCFETVENGKLNVDIEQALLNVGVTKKMANEIIVKIKKNDCVLVFEYFDDITSNYLEKHLSQQLYPKIEYFYEENNKFLSAERKLQCHFNIDETDWIFQENEKWSPVIKDILHSKGFQCTLICGGNNVGKSTFLRYLVNKLLSVHEKVLCIDVDPGQTEFTVSGCVSASAVCEPLLGPNYTHLKQPDRCEFVGDTNVSACSGRYLSCVETLLKYCHARSEFKNIPWIINTMGFCRGLGIYLTSSLIDKFAPTRIIQIMSKSAENNFPSILTPEFVASTLNKQVNLTYKLDVIDSVSSVKKSGRWRSDARQTRDLCLMAYFSQMFQNNEMEVADIVPYITRLSLIQLTVLKDNTSENYLESVFNASLVALCSQNQCCVGFGIVRGIDMENQKLYLVTPLSLNEMNNVTSLMLGSITLPLNLFVCNSVGFKPYLSIGKIDNISKIPKRSYFKPYKFNNN